MSALLVTPELLIGNITMFVLAIFLGFELITKVPPTLHTPLMSGANAISGISIIGALIGANVAFNARTGYIEHIGIHRFGISYDQRSGWICRNQSNAQHDRWKEERGN